VITTYAFLAAFLAIGIAVMIAAFSGGRRQEPTPARARHGTGRRVVAVLVGAVVVVIGVIVPALVMAGGDATREGPGGTKLTAADEDARELFHDRCSQCHKLRAANAVGKVGPSLDQLRPPAQLTLDAIENGRARGQGQMPAGLVDGQEARELAAFIEKVAGR
jgi:cytochrome c553